MKIERDKNSNILHLSLVQVYIKCKFIVFFFTKIILIKFSFYITFKVKWSDFSNKIFRISGDVRHFPRKSRDRTASPETQRLRLRQTFDNYYEFKCNHLVSLLSPLISLIRKRSFCWQNTKSNRNEHEMTAITFPSIEFQFIIYLHFNGQLPLSLQTLWFPWSRWTTASISIVRFAIFSNKNYLHNDLYSDFSLGFSDLENILRWN